MIVRGSTTLDHIAEEGEGVTTQRNSSLKKSKKKVRKNPLGDTAMNTPPQNTIEMFTSGDMRRMNHTLFNKKPNYEE
jgi:hypothetical protein